MLNLNNSSNVSGKTSVLYYPGHENQQDDNLYALVLNHPPRHHYFERDE